MANDNKVEYQIAITETGSAAATLDQLKKLQSQGDATSAAFDKLKGSAEKVLAAIGAEELLRKSIDEFAEEERAISRLDAALRSTGQYSPALRKELLDLADSFKEVTSFDGDQLITLISKLVAFGAPSGGLPRLVTSVLDLSTLMERDLSRATGAVIRGMQGEFTEFERLGFKIDEAASVSTNFNSILEQIAKTAGGQAVAAAKSFGGELDSLKKNWKELLQVIGESIAPLVSKLAELAKGIRQFHIDATGRPELIEEIKRERAAYDDMAESIRKAIIEKVRLGEMTKEEAGKLSQQISLATEPLRYLRQGTTQEMRDILSTSMPNVEAHLRQIDQRAGTGAVAPLSAKSDASFTQPDPNKVRQAQEELRQLENQMRLEQLQGYEKEREQVGITYDDRLKKLNDLRNQEGISIEQQMIGEGDAERAYIKGLETIQEKEDDARNHRLLADQAEMLAAGALETEMRNQLLALSVHGENSERLQLRITQEERLAKIAELKLRDQDRYDNLMELEGKLRTAEDERFEKEHSASGKFLADMKQVGEQAERLFSEGLAGAIVDAFEEGDKAFQKFAANFLREIAKMILQTIILAEVQAIVRGVQSALGFAADGGQFGPSSSQVSHGAARLAGGGMAGISRIDTATFFPKFNVLAGEGGSSEVMTVLSHPQLTTIAGITAQLGSVQGRKLAIVDASQLAGLGVRKMAAGGMEGASFTPSSSGSPTGQSGNIVIEVSLGQGLEARIIQNSVAASVVQVTRQLGRDGALSQAARKLTT